MLNLKSGKWIIAVLVFLPLLMIATNLSFAETNTEDSSYKAEFRILQDEELKSIKAGTNCQNSFPEAGKNPGKESEEPVNLNNGNMFMPVTDLLIPALGPDLEISRTHNSQITSRVYGWQPERGAGPWALEDGEYSGQGDRTVLSGVWLLDVDLTLDMKTVEAGANHAWETARVNFRYQDKFNTYYVTLLTDGTLELSKMQDGEYYLLDSKPGVANPLSWNNIEIKAKKGKIKVTVNGKKAIKYTDPNPIYLGRIALEAYFCHSHFDNVVQREWPLGRTYTFNYEDNDTIFGKNWTFNYGLTATGYMGGSMVILREDGRKDTFVKDPDTPYAYIPPYKVFDTLTRTPGPDFTFTLRLKNGTEYHFDTDGKLLSITDRNSNTVTLSYGLIQGKLKPITITDASGRSLTLEYGSNGMVSKIIDPLAREILYTYDVDDNLISVTDPRGNSRTYAYDLSHTINTYTNPEGNVYTYTYYYNNRTATQTDPVGNVTTFDYVWDVTWVTNDRGQTTFYHFFEDDNQLASVDDLLGNIEYYTYDEYGNRTSVKDKNGNVTTFTYDTNGNMLSETDPLSNTTTYTYESIFNRVTSITYPNGNQTLFDHDLNGNLIKITDALNNITTFAYDIYGNHITTTDPLTNITTYAYNQHGNRTSITDALNNQTQFGYDLVSRLTSLTDANNHTTIHEYDATDNLVTTTDASGNITTFVYDGLNRKISETDPALNTTAFEYNYAGDVTKITDTQNNQTIFTYDLTNYIHLGVSNKISETDAIGNATTYDYDNENQLIKITDAKGGITQYFYDPNGNIIKITDAKLHDTTYTYDVANRLISTTYHDALTEESTYDNNGNTLTEKDKKGQVITYAYDALNRMTTKTYPDLSIVDYTYDVLYRLLTVTDSNGTITHTYDAVGRLTSVTYPNNLQVSYQYDPVGNRTQLTYPNNDVVTYTYDVVNRVTTITTPQLQNVTFSYDNLNRRAVRTLPNGTFTSYSYDSLDRLLNLTNSKGVSIISSFDYTYDNVGNRTSMVTQEGTSSYSYDNIYQLTNVVDPDLTSTDYSFDSVGNRTQVNQTTYITNFMNQYTQVGQANFYDYDQNGSMISKTVDGLLTIYSYDYENRLTSVTTPDQGVVSFTYGPFGHLIQRNENFTITNYIYDGDRIIAEADEANQITRIYLYGTGVDEVLTMSKFFDWGVGIWYYDYDGLGSVSEITDWQGNLLEEYTYDEYGSFTIKDSSGNPLDSSPSGNRFYFTGREYDFLTGLYYYRARWYDPAIGRFLQTDPIGYASGINLYTYVKNNPVNWVDPLGLEKTRSLADGIKNAQDWNDTTETFIEEGDDEGVTRDKKRNKDVIKREQEEKKRREEEEKKKREEEEKKKKKCP